MHPLHSKIAAILPWYLNGTLGLIEAEAVEKHLGECLVCAREAKRLEQLSFVVAVPHQEHACSQAFSRLTARIHSEPPPRTLAASLLATLRAAFEPVSLAAGASLLASSAVVVAVIVVAGSGQMRAPEQPFQTQGAATSISVPLDRPQFRIVLEEDFALDAWLERYQARVIDGPSSIGVLTVDVAMASGNFDVVLNRIRADEQTIFVEAVDVIGVRPDRQR